MSRTLKANLLKYGISLAICAVMVYVFLDSRAFSIQALVDKYLILCDAFTLPAVLFLGAGALVALSNQGILDGLTYACGLAFKALLPGGRLKTEKYYDYVQRKKASRISGYSFLFVVGFVCLALAGVFMYLFYQLY